MPQMSPLWWYFFLVYVFCMVMWFVFLYSDKMMGWEMSGGSDNLVLGWCW